ncbi:hypothetical protein [Roseivirga sp. 4D4]|uniref:hypothetical protein n=1 Tax=Roseivirga sp. 4D4 TaxID=1889784 RepID=UPI001112FAD9|nr:hypothetical protein [Roseivirga sp. 4D4]
MASSKENQQQSLDYLKQEIDKEVETKRQELMQDVQRQMAEKQFVGPEFMQKEAYQNELNRLNNEAQKELMVFETQLETEYYKDFGGSREAAEKLLSLDHLDSNFNEKSNTDQTKEAPELDQDFERSSSNLINPVDPGMDKE